MPLALETAAESSRLVQTHRLRGFIATPTKTVLAATRLAATEVAPAAEHAVRMREAERACRAAWEHRRQDRGAAPEAARWMGTYEWLRGRPDRARQWWDRSLAAAERLPARYELARTHGEIGKRRGDLPHLQQAAALFAELGAQHDWEQVRALLGDAAGSAESARRSDLEPREM